MITKAKRMKGRRKRRRRIILLFIAAVFLIATVVFVVPFVAKVIETKNKISYNLGRDGSPLREGKVHIKDSDPISILLLGVDEEVKGNPGRSDSMILVTINPKLSSVKMLSIPRDTRVKIPGKKNYQKINAAYALGGPELAIDTVESVFDVPIDYFVQINFEGFKDMVDAVDGIEIENKFAFSDNGMDFPKGVIHLNGEQALTFVRMRHSDPNGDYGRQERQRNAIMQIVKKGKSFKSISNTNSILDAIGNNVKTNIEPLQMWDIKNDYASAINNIETVQIQATSKKIDKQDYELILYDERIRVTELLRTHLDLPLKPSSSYPNKDAEMMK